MIFEREKLDTATGLFGFLDLLDLDGTTTFEVVSKNENPINPEVTTYIFQQYSQGIPVLGGGFTISGIFAPGPGPGPGPSHICDRPHAMTPHLFNDINVNVNPSFPEVRLDTLLGSYLDVPVDSIMIEDSELVISNEFNSNCEFALIWEVAFFSDGPKKAYIDAHDGEVLMISDNILFFEAFTPYYGQVTLDNLIVDGVAKMISPDQRLLVYEANTFVCTLTIGTIHLNPQRIPQTTGSSWFGSGHTSNVNQAFWVTQQILPILEAQQILINDTIHIAASCMSIAGYYKTNRKGNHHLMLGRRLVLEAQTTVNLSTFDIVAHELGHGYLHNFIDSDRVGVKTLHEGIADFIAVYVLYKLSSNTPWVFGSDLPDHPDIQEIYGKDLTNPEYTCFNSVKNEKDDISARIGPLGYFFHLLTEGHSGLGIQGLGIDKAFSIIQSALPELNRRHADYKELMEATINQVIEHYGLCSPEFKTLIKAWQTICMDTDFPIIRKGNVVNLVDCEFFVHSTQTTFCWDAQNADFCLNLPSGVIHGVNPSQITWTITGPGSASFDSQLGMQVNQQQGGLCLNIIQIPELPYYPRNYNVRVTFNTTQGFMFINFPFTMYDCTGTKPTCYEYHNSNALRIIPNEGESEEESDIEELGNLTKEDASILMIHDMLGRLIYNGDPNEWDAKFTSFNQLFIFSYFSEDMQLILTEKRVHVNRD